MLKNRFKISTRVHVLVVLVAVAGVWGLGCSSWQARPYVDPGDLKVRPASNDTARILRNASYYQLMGRPEAALKELEEAHQLDPNNLELANNLAGYYEQLGRTERAQQIYLEALSQAPDNQALNNNLCFSYYQAGNWQQAEACFRKALESQPSNAMARNNLGLLLCRQGKQEEARRLWQEAEGALAADQKLSAALATLTPAGPGSVAAAAASSRPLIPVPAPQASASRAVAVPGLQASAAPVAGAPAGSKATPVETRHPVAPAAPGKLAAVPVTPAPEPVPPRTSAATSPAPAKPRAAAASPAPSPAVANQPEVSPVKPVSPPPAAREGQSKPQRPVAKAAGPVKTQEKPALTGGHLTAQELVETGIAVRNGNGISNIAHETRSLLAQEGFNVVEIGNHLDFGVDHTVIYYRPGAEKVARSLKARFFRDALMESRGELTGGVDVKILLGHDLPRQQADAGGPGTG